MIDIKEQLDCGRLLRDFRQRKGPEEFGYWIQGMAAHILLQTGLIDLEINTSGHPDISGFLNGGKIKFEIEADCSGKGLHSLTQPDIEGMRPLSPLDKSYYALLKATVLPEWILVPYKNCSKILKPLQIPIIETYCDREYSSKWTKLLIRIVIDNQDKIFTLNYSRLREMAICGRTFNNSL